MLRSVAAMRCLKRGLALRNQLLLPWCKATMKWLEEFQKAARQNLARVHACRRRVDLKSSREMQFFQNGHADRQLLCCRAS